MTKLNSKSRSTSNMRHCLIWFYCILPLGVEMRLTIPELVQQLQMQHPFEYVLLVGNSEITWLQTIWELPVPIVQLSNKPNISYQLERYHTRRLLSIASVDESPNDLLEFLTLNLRVWNTESVLLVFKKNNNVESVLAWCWQEKQLLNVIAIVEDFNDTGIIYSYSPFPQFQLESRRISRTTYPIIIPRLQNLFGYKIPIAIGGSMPRLIVHRRLSGQLVYSGFIGHLMQCFEKKYNCGLIQPQPLDELTTVPANQLIGAVRSGIIQFALGAVIPFPEKVLEGYTYPFELLDWCIMLPASRPVPVSELYTRVLDLNTFLIILVTVGSISALLSLSLRHHGYNVRLYEFLLHESCLRGVLGQSFCEVIGAPILVRGIYLKICIFGFLVTAWYNSFFSAYITSNPLQKPLNSYDSILNSNLKVLIWATEYQSLLMYHTKMKKFEAIFKIEPDYEKFLKMRDSFNTDYGYVMPLEKWNIVKQQQKYFSSILFTMREDLCFFRGVPSVFAIAENCVFREPLDRLIGEVTATGLMAHWHDMAFSEMIKAGKLRFVDFGQPNEFRAMQLMDLDYILMAAGLMMILATAVFVLEQLWFRQMQLRRYLCKDTNQIMF